MNPVLRALLNLPRFLFRLRLGWIFGHRFLMLTHRGRRSGRTLDTVVEVVRYDPATQECLVMAGWGERTQWYQNLRAGGALQVDVAGRRYRPQVRFLTPDEAYAEMRDYLRRNRWASSVARRLFGLRFDGTDAQTDTLRCVGLRPRPDRVNA